MAQPKRTWLDGPLIPSQFSDDEAGFYPGQGLGLPRSGPGSLATVMRRAVGVFIDWTVAYIVAGFVGMFTTALGNVPTMAYLFFFLMGTISGWIFARTPGQAVLGMGVARVDAPGSRVGFVRALARTALTCLIFPAALVDADGRGMHDRATGTTVIRG